MAEIKRITQDRRRYARHNLRLAVLGRDKYRCRYCGARVTLQTANIDHVVPWLYGGQTKVSNLVAACRACNKRKGNKFLKPRRIPRNRKAKAQKNRKRK